MRAVAYKNAQKAKLREQQRLAASGVNGKAAAATSNKPPHTPEDNADGPHIGSMDGDSSYGDEAPDPADVGLDPSIFEADLKKPGFWGSWWRLHIVLQLLGGGCIVAGVCTLHSLMLDPFCRLCTHPPSH